MKLYHHAGKIFNEKYSINGGIDIQTGGIQSGDIIGRLQIKKGSDHILSTK